MDLHLAYDTVLIYFNRLSQSYSHIGGLLFKIQNLRSYKTNDSCTSRLCTWKVPRKVNQRARPLSSFNLAKPRVESDSERSSLGALSKFDPRHSADKNITCDEALSQLKSLKKNFPQTGWLFGHMNKTIK